jgi:predicted ATPase/DNA-binding SARP family transcriptional activator/DNA-binding CsgD family transcriptional regulator
VGLRIIEDSQWRLRKAAALVKLLALAPGHRLHREQAMDILWPDSGRKAASNSLRKTLHAARRTLDPAEGSGYLASEDESLVLCPGGELWVDVEAFEEAAATARRSKDPAAYRAALDLYGGELSPEDRYEGWAEEPRRRLHETYLSLLLGLARLNEELGYYEPAVEALRRGVAEEPTREEAHVGLMRLYALLGSNAEALAQYGRLEEVLLRELGTEPTASSRALREEIAAGRFPPNETPSLTHLPEEALATGKHNLPASRTSFVGRKREILEIKRELVMTRLLTLTGPGGSGKTRLALEVARSLVGAYPDGVWLVELASISEAELVPQSVARILEIREQPGLPLTDTLVDALRAKQMLLILDNCEHLIDAVGDLVALLLDACPHLRILATSRQALRAIGEVTWTVSLLSVPDLSSPPTVAQLEGYESVRLFVDRARQPKPAFALRFENAQAVALICAYLEGLPLAIELAAARIKMLPPQALLERIRDRFKLLTGGSRELSERQRTLRSTIEWSYELLEEEEKALFGRLSVFSGGATLEATEVVCNAAGVHSVDALEDASSLLDKSLLGREEGVEGETRLEMLETIREYAQEKLEESGEVETIKRAHAEYFLSLAEEAEPMLWGPDDAAWLDRLEREHDNMRAALSWSMEQDEVELALRLGGALRWFWHMTGYYSEGRNWLEAALDKEGPASTEARIKALAGVGSLAQDQGDFDRAEAAAEEGLKLSVEAGLGEEVAAEIQNELSDVARQRGDYERAAALCEASLAFHRKAKNTVGIAWSLGTLSNVVAYRGDHERAMQLYEEGIALCRQLGGAYLLGAFLINLGYVYLLEGNLERATALNQEAADLFREQGRRSGGLQYALDNLGWAMFLRGEYDKASTLLKESLALCHEVGDRMIASEILEGLACSAGAKGEARRAARLFGAAEALREAIGYQQTPRHVALAEPFLEAGRSRLDEAAWEKAFTEGRAMGLDEAVEYALSERVSATPEQSSAGAQPPSLSRREQEVASLLVRGLTNRQIASELVISEHTAATHVRRILKKLGLQSRSQIGSWLAEQRPSSTDPD